MRIKILLTNILTLLLLGACQDHSSEYIFDQSVNERFLEKQQEILTALQSSGHGWKGEYVRNGEVGGVTFLFDFIDNNYVVLKSDFRSTQTMDTITYRIEKAQSVQLVFETHSVLHEIFEINYNQSGGEFVFSVNFATQDSVRLTSKTDNGYAGAMITVLDLIPAREDEWDLSSLYASHVRLQGDPTKSVFRGIFNNGNPISGFSYDALNRMVTLNYMDSNGNNVKGKYPITITEEGFSFVSPVTIEGVVLKSFTYRESDASFTDSNGSSLVYSQTPFGPLTPYDFGQAANNIRSNYLETGKSSANWHSFFNLYNTNIKNNYGFTVSRVYIYGLSGDEPYLYLYLQAGSETSRYYYDLSYEIKEDGKVYFTLTGSTNTSVNLRNILAPLVDLLIGSEKGYYVEGTGRLLNYTNGTFNMINADDPSFAINYYGF